MDFESRLLTSQVDETTLISGGDEASTISAATTKRGKKQKGRATGGNSNKHDDSFELVGATKESQALEIGSADDDDDDLEINDDIID